MNKGFANYFTSGFSSAHGTIKRSKFNIFKYYLINICIILARIGIVTIPLAKLLSVRTGQMIAQEERIDIYNAYRSTDRPKSYIEAIFYMIVEGLLLTAGAILFILVGALLVLLAYTIAGDLEIFITLAVIFNIPTLIGLIVFNILFVLYFRPGWYIMDKNPQMCNTAIMYNANQAMKHGGKRTAFALDFMYYLIESLFLGILIGISVLLIFLVDETIGTIVAIVAGLLIIFVYPFFKMAHSASLAHFYNDIKLIYPNYEYDTSINERKVAKGHGHLKLKASNKESVLLSLFDNEPVSPKEEAPLDPTPYNMPSNDYESLDDYNEEIEDVNSDNEQ